MLKSDIVRTALKACGSSLWSESAITTNGHALTSCLTVLYKRGFVDRGVGNRKRVKLLVDTVTRTLLPVLLSMYVSATNGHRIRLA